MRRQMLPITCNVCIKEESGWPGLWPLQEIPRDVFNKSTKLHAAPRNQANENLLKRHTHTLSLLSKWLIRM